MFKEILSVESMLNLVLIVLFVNGDAVFYSKYTPNACNIILMVKLTKTLSVPCFSSPSPS